MALELKLCLAAKSWLATLARSNQQEAKTYLV